MRSAASYTLLAATLGLSSACGAAPERQLGVRTPPFLSVQSSPPAVGVVDSDRDGVTDPRDACPGLPGVPSTVVVLNGCPPPGYYDDRLGTRDRDGDGILDGADACPEDPGPAEIQGCAVPPDSDGDGVPDAGDACRQDPGPARSEAGVTGCPAAWIDGDRVRILEQVRFGSGSAELLPESAPVLEAVAAVLTRRADITKLRVEGHTDGRGGPVMNRKLSLGRATRVARFLSDHGILATRLDAEGIGPDRPLAKDDTEQGRATNRRVEFRVVSVAERLDPTPSGGLLPAEPERSPARAPDSSGL